MDAINRQGLVIRGLRSDETIPVAASTALEAACDAHLVLFSVKTPGTETVAAELAPRLGEDAVVVSLQNGVDNADRIHQVTGLAPLAAAVYVAVEMAGPGTLRHTGRGDLLLGDPLGETGLWERRDDLLRKVAGLFTGAGVPCEIPESIRSELWSKLIMNCAFNAVSALTGARYGAIVRDEAARIMLSRVIEESVAVAAAAGVALSLPDMLRAAWHLGGDAMPGAISSTAQDLSRGRKTEIDSLNGYVSRLGSKLEVDVPLNQALHALVKLAEQRAARSAG